MAITREVTLNYYDQGDTLWIHIYPDRPAMESMAAYDFYTRYDRENPNEIIGFKILDFSHFISHIDEEGVLPDFTILFDIPELSLKSLSLRELLNNVYSEFVLKKEPMLSKVAF